MPTPWPQPRPSRRNTVPAVAAAGIASAATTVATTTLMREPNGSVAIRAPPPPFGKCCCLLRHAVLRRLDAPAAALRPRAGHGEDGRGCPRCRLPGGRARRGRAERHRRGTAGHEAERRRRALAGRGLHGRV